jgi:O-antigen/teichoic acid export membrane protein
MGASARDEAREAAAATPEPDPASTGTLLPGSAITGLRSTLGIFSRNSLVYVLGEGGVRAVTLLVTPLYTHAMTPKDYGILAVATTASMIVTLTLSLQLDSAVSRLWLEGETDEARRRLIGTILIFLLTFPLLASFGLEVLGDLGALNIFRSVPYAPYLRYSLWIGYVWVFPFLPIAYYTVRGEAAKVLRLRFLTVTVQIPVGVVLIVVLHQGVLGALRALLAGGAVTAVVSIALMVPKASFRFSSPLLKGSLAFCLPIIPHALANWALQLSDRVVLQSYVNDTQLGLYQLGYLVGGAATFFTNSAAAAVQPLFYWRLRDESARQQVAPLGSYVLLILSFFCVLLALFGSTAILVLTPHSYRGAAEIVPWIASSYVFVSAYVLLTVPTWYVKRTLQIALGTIAAALVNIGATFLFGSMFGIVGAGISTLIGYVFLAVIQGLIADRLFPIAWEYRRWMKILTVSGACLGIGLAIGDQASAVSIILRLVVMIGGFPLGLHLTRFWTAEERAELKRLARSILRGLTRRPTASP